MDPAMDDVSEFIGLMPKGKYNPRDPQGSLLSPSDTLKVSRSKRDVVYTRATKGIKRVAGKLEKTGHRTLSVKARTIRGGFRLTVGTDYAGWSLHLIFTAATGYSTPVTVTRTVPR
jgi:hypothetical protein